MEWFAPFDGTTVASCRIAGDLGTPLGLAVDGNGAAYLASARAATAGVWRYKGSFPKDASSCATTLPPTATNLIPAGTQGLSAPTAVAVAQPDQALVVTSAPDDLVVAFALDASDSLVVQAKSQVAVSPFGVAVSPDGSVIYTDLGLAADAKGVLSPGDRTGALLSVSTGNGTPGAPSVMDRGLDAPDGLGLYIPGARGGAASKV